MAEKRFLIGEALRFGWDTWKENIGFFLGLTVISMAVYGIPSILNIFIGEPESLYGLYVTLLTFVTIILFWPVQIIIGMGLIKIALKFVDGEKAEFADLFGSYRLFWCYLGATILAGLIYLAGFLLLIIPGIIWSIKYFFATYEVVDKEFGPVESIKRSGVITKGAKWQIFLFLLVVFLIAVGGFLAFIVGLFVAIPVTMLATAYVYRKLESKADPAVAVALTPEPVPF